MDYDVIIIGAGVTGCAVARELSRYRLRIAVLDKNWDIGEGTSKANSGIVHAGFDAMPGSLKAKLNVAGSQMMPSLAKALGIPFMQNGSLVVALSKDDRLHLDELFERGLKNGVKGLRILSRNEALEMEPNLSDKTAGALFAPTGGIICPFRLTSAMAESACINIKHLATSRTDATISAPTASSLIPAAVRNRGPLVRASGSMPSAMMNLTPKATGISP